MSDQSVTERKAKDVQYDVDVLTDSLPDVEQSSRASILREKTLELYTDPEKFMGSNGPQWRSIASYSNKGSATGAMQSLRAHFGKDKEGSGFFFTVRRVNDRVVLFAKFDGQYRKSDFPEPGMVPKAEGRAHQGANVGKTEREEAETPGG